MNKATLNVTWVVCKPSLEAPTELAMWLGNNENVCDANIIIPLPELFKGLPNPSGMSHPIDLGDLMNTAEEIISIGKAYRKEIRKRRKELNV